MNLYTFDEHMVRSFTSLLSERGSGMKLFGFLFSLTALMEKRKIKFVLFD